jgi:hypothetical protein
MNTEEKPNASLTAQEVLEIVTDLDNKILEASKQQIKARENGTEYISFLAKEIAYMECRNLILSKL